jgi:hypothetical protein
MIKRLLRADRAVVHGMVVGEQEQIEAGTNERLQSRRTALEVVGRGLSLAVRDEIVAVGDHRLEIDEGEVAVDVARDA